MERLDIWLQQLNRFIANAKEDVTVVLAPGLGWARHRVLRHERVYVQVQMGIRHGCSGLHTPWLVIVNPHDIEPKLREDLFSIRCLTKDGRELPVIFEFVQSDRID